MNTSSGAMVIALEHQKLETNAGQDFRKNLTSKH